MTGGVELRFEGRPIPGRLGDSLAACLTAAGERGLRHTASGGLRGVFCGMGVCQDCLVEVDGVPDQRACMTKVTGPHDIRRQPALTRARSGLTGPPDAPDLPVATPDVAVLGGGAAGLAAAAAAAECGLDVLLIDERPVPGGQYFKQPAGGRAIPDAQAREGARLLARARASGARFLDAAAWGAFAPLTLALTGADGARLVTPRRLIVATGAYERAWPVPGWTLPGVMTTGAAQTLLRSYGVVAGQRVLLAGNGPLNLQVALELARAGAEVVAVAELAPAAPAGRAGAILTMLGADPRLLARGIGIRAGLQRHGIRVLPGHCLRDVEATPGRLRARLATWDGVRLGDGPGFEVDAVAIGYGFLPADDVLRALGAAQVFDPATQQRRAVRDAQGRTTEPDLYAVGDCCGLGGAHAARAEGLVAGLAAAISLGRSLAGKHQREDRRARAGLARHRRFQAGLWRLFAATSPAAVLATPDTVICRCEEVSQAYLDDVLTDGAPAIGALKRLTRAGMGRCQGRYCAPVLASQIAARDGQPVDADSFFAPRPPIKPVRIGDLIRPAGR